MEDHLALECADVYHHLIVLADREHYDRTETINTFARYFLYAMKEIDAEAFDVHNKSHLN